MDRWFYYYITVPRWSRRCILFFLFVIIFLLIVGPSYFRHMFWEEVPIPETPCDVSKLISNLYHEVQNANARVDGYSFPTSIQEKLLFVGNGYIGVPLNEDFSLYIRSGRTLSLHIPYYPSVRIKQFPIAFTEQTALHFTNGIAIIDKCYHNKIRISYEYFAHRSNPSIFVQEITILNSFSEPFIFDLEQKGQSLWDSTKKRVMKLFNSEKNKNENFDVLTGKVLDSSNKKMYVVSIVSHTIAAEVQVPANTEYKFQVLMSVVYNESSRAEFSTLIGITENKAVSNMELALSKPYQKLKMDHVNVWNKLWNTGFFISYSKAKGALNGDMINATIYYVLSSVQAFYHEETTPNKTRSFVTNSLSYAEGCYGSNHHTLEAENLWRSCESMGDMNEIVSLWLLTLEKQGCYNLVKAGADGVIQAMVLSFGSFRFNKQHLEFNMHPSFLHRTYHFRRINYGNQTHVNVTVEVDENNKAILYVALDQSDKTYYACDGGCLDKPVELGPKVVQLPVKLTKPFTAILYITSDKQHMEELRHTLHVKDVAEAPAQEHTLLIMHKHGHHLGGLPTFFWVSIFTLIVIFHLFLIKMVYNEYWNQQTKYNTKPAESIYRSNSKYRNIH